MLQKCLVLIIVSCCITHSYAQNPVITIVDTSKRVSIRGLSVVDNATIWCSGNYGSVARSIDGGKTFKWQTIKGYEKYDFRDIEAFDANTAIIMGIAEPAIILKTKDGGQTWQKVFEDTTKGMFLDAMAFDRKGNGWVIGDPINNQFYKAFTKNNGDSWINLTNIDAAKALQKGEAFFASSGTNIKINSNKNYPVIFATGGVASRLFFNDAIYSLPLNKGKESTGANSIDIWKNKAVVVGGDFANDKDTSGNCVLISLKKLPVFTKPQAPPNGYRSCVVYVNKNTLVSCGTSGVDISYDGGNNWQLISTKSFHVVQKAKKGNAIYLAGSGGKIARLEL
ncbi:MAG: oxidoreductase [Deinococcales bacterium]|nr:oxidoreductase [Chitinophagaceae bacterium]